MQRSAVRLLFMVALLIIAAANYILATRSVSGQTNGAHTSVFRSNGAYADLSLDNPQLVGMMSVSRIENSDNAGSREETMLYVTISRRDSGEIIQDWFGNIPNEAFIVSGNSARLYFDPSTVPDRQGIGGVIDVTWTKNNKLTYHGTGSSIMKFNPDQRNGLKYVVNGNSSNETATATGTISGLAIGETYQPGTVIGEYLQANIMISREAAQ